MEKIGAMYPQAVKDSIRDWVGKGYVGSFYDAYNQEARTLFWKQMNDHLADWELMPGGWMPPNLIFSRTRALNKKKTNESDSPGFFYPVFQCLRIDECQGNL